MNCPHAYANAARCVLLSRSSVVAATALLIIRAELRVAPAGAELGPYSAGVLRINVCPTAPQFGFVRLFPEPSMLRMSPDRKMRASSDSGMNEFQGDTDERTRSVRRMINLPRGMLLASPQW